MLEDQSKRIAQAVHHQTDAILTAVLARLEESERELAPACGSCFQEVRTLLLQVEQQLGDISYDLRPAILDRDGLLGAIRLLCDRVAGRTGIAVTLTGSIRGRLPHAVETALYRVTQEALTNAA